jgi:hypothetical protein
MIRFSATEEEIGTLLRFLKRRAPENHLLLVPLRPHSRDRRLRRTERALLNELSRDTTATRWGIYTALDTPPSATRGDEDSCLILLQLSAADNDGRREALLEARDEMTSDRRRLTKRSLLARNLVNRCARRLRRRGHPEKGRWVIE